MPLHFLTFLCSLNKLRISIDLNCWALVDIVVYWHLLKYKTLFFFPLYKLMCPNQFSLLSWSVQICLAWSSSWYNLSWLDNIFTMCLIIFQGVIPQLPESIRCVNHDFIVSLEVEKLWLKRPNIPSFFHKYIKLYFYQQHFFWRITYIIKN